MCRYGLAMLRRGHARPCVCSARNPCPPGGIVTSKRSTVVVSSRKEAALKRLGRARTSSGASLARLEPLSTRGYCDQKRGYGSRSILEGRRPSGASVRHVLHQEHPWPDWIPWLSLTRVQAYVPTTLRGGCETIEGPRLHTIRGLLHAGLRFCNASISDPRIAAGASHFGLRLIETGRELPLRWLDRGESVTLVAPYGSSM